MIFADKKKDFGGLGRIIVNRSNSKTIRGYNNEYTGKF